MPPEDLEEVQAWMTKAAHDLRAAAHLLQVEEPLRDIVVYHCQQAMEKALKGYLTFEKSPSRGRERHPHRARALGPPRPHDHHDLHPRAEPVTGGSPLPGRAYAGGPVPKRGVPRSPLPAFHGGTTRIWVTPRSHAGNAALHGCYAMVYGLSVLDLLSALCRPGSRRSPSYTGLWNVSWAVGTKP